MHQNGRGTKQKDGLLRMQGKLDRGPVEFKSHIVEQEGEIMAIATRNVVCVPPTRSILAAAEEMTKCGFRRLPVTDPGTDRIRGIITSGDIISLMGGGDKFSLVQVRHGGNLLPALNEPVRAIMTQQLETLPSDARIRDAVEVIVKKKIGGLPLVGKDGAIAGIVTERDVMRMLASERSRLRAEDVMSSDLRVTGPDSPIATVTREMTRHKLRRLPVVSNDVLYGIITATDIMRYLGTREIFSRITTGRFEEVASMPVRELVGGELVITTPTRSINDVAREMLEKNIGSLPVIEDSRLIGLVTEFDLVKAFAAG